MVIHASHAKEVTKLIQTIEFAYVSSQFAQVIPSTPKMDTPALPVQVTNIQTPHILSVSAVSHLAWETKSTPMMDAPAHHVVLISSQMP